MNQFVSRSWVAALCWRVLLYAVCGALISALSGAFWGVVFGGGVNLAVVRHSGLLAMSPSGPSGNLLVDYPGLGIGARLGATIGAGQGIIFFFIGAWKASPLEHGLSYNRGYFWFLMRLLPAGQTVGVLLGSISIALLLALYETTTGVPRDEVVQSITVNIMWSAPLSLVLGGILGGLLGLTRAATFRRQMVKANVTEHSGA